MGNQCKFFFTENSFNGLNVAASHCNLREVQLMRKCLHGQNGIANHQDILLAYIWDVMRLP